MYLLFFALPLPFFLPRHSFTNGMLKKIFHSWMGFLKNYLKKFWQSERHSWMPFPTPEWEYFKVYRSLPGTGMLYHCQNMVEFKLRFICTPCSTMMGIFLHFLFIGTVFYSIFVPPFWIFTFPKMGVRSHFIFHSKKGLYSFLEYFLH